MGDPFRNVSGADLAGQVVVVFGSASGLTSDRSLFLIQGGSTIGGTPENGDEFGFSLASGDFDHDAFADLIVGIPGEGGPARAGAVQILYGSTGGPSGDRDKVWTQDSAGIIGIRNGDEQFGYALAAGSFDGDAFDDLAIGVPFEHVVEDDGGTVNVLYGSGSGLRSERNQVWNLTVSGVPGTAKKFDETGFALTSGDFDADGRFDLVIGVPGEDDPTNRGAAVVIYGSPTGLASARAKMWTQASTGVPGNSTTGDRMGFSLAAANFGSGPQDDLVMGIAMDDTGGLKDPGGFVVLYGSDAGLGTAGAHLWTQDSDGIPNAKEDGDRFGWSAAA